MLDSHVEPIHVVVPMDGTDPRKPLPPDPPGVIVHRVPALHPDDMDVVDGIPCTSASRTLIDCAEDATPTELWAMMLRARELGLFDPDAIEASLSRVEWRPSLAMFRSIFDSVRALA